VRVVALGTRKEAPEKWIDEKRFERKGFD